jgi:2-phospho-L-lactate/phosphoenolpyruvate guanylyltransferase
MRRASVWAVVPVKPFDEAKLRLAPVLDVGERAHLVRLMFEDVLTALTASRHLLGGVLVATADRQAAEIARRYGASVLAEDSPSGLNSAIEQAIGRIPSAADGMLVVPADLPQLSAPSIAQIVRLLDAPKAVALVQAPADGGTNMLACRPAGVIPPLFGPQSFWRHREAARHAGIRTLIVRNRELEQDLDRPDDLVAFLSMETAVQTRTHAFVSSLDIADRLAGGAQLLNRGMTSRAIVSI